MPILSEIAIAVLLVIAFVIFAPILWMAFAAWIEEVERWFMK